MNNMNNINNINNICTFYATKWHLIIKILPYLISNIEENNQIIIFTEKDLYENLKIVSQKVNIPRMKNVLDIDWSITEINNKIEQTIKNKMNKKYKKCNNKRILIINGNIKYINEINKKIQEILKSELKKENDAIEIIDCYNIINDIKLLVAIKEKYQKKLETSGILRIV